MLLNPLMVGEWDGCNLWVQWTPAPDATQATRYIVRVRMRTPGTEWRPWLVLGNPTAKCFRRVQTQRQGWEIQCDVAVMPEPVSPTIAPAPEAPLPVTSHQSPVTAPRPSLPLPEWESASEVTFDRSRARFRFDLAEGRQPVSLEKGLIVSSTVDGAACSYRLTEALDILPGVPIESDLEALHFTGWCQLDHPGHFTARIQTGLTCANILPSTNDLKPTVAEGQPPKVFTKLTKLAHPGGPGVLVVTGRNWLAPMSLQA